MLNVSRFCVLSLRRDHANLLCIVQILVYVQQRRIQLMYALDHIASRIYNVVV